MTQRLVHSSWECEPDLFWQQEHVDIGGVHHDLSKAMLVEAPPGTVSQPPFVDFKRGIGTGSLWFRESGDARSVPSPCV